MDVSKPFSQQYGAPVLTTESPWNPAAHWNNRGETFQVKQADPTALMMTDPSSSDLTPRNLSDYAANCQSLRNLVKPPNYSHVSLPPESLINEADNRRLSIKELDVMHEHMNQKTEITIGGQNFELEKLAKDAPMFYQFYCLDDEKSIDEKSIAIFERNCDVEKSRPVIILTHSSLINKKLNSQIEMLVNKYENVFSVDMKKLLPKLQIPGIRITEGKDSDGDFFLNIDPTGYFSQDSICSHKHAWKAYRISDIMDTFHCVAAYHCDKVCIFAGAKNSGPGCLKIDWDTQFLEPTKEIQCPNGIRTFVIDSLSRQNISSNYNHLNHILRTEMSLVAVTRPRHPVMAKALTKEEDIYGGFRIAIYDLFNQPIASYDSNQEEVTLVPDDCESLAMMCFPELRSKIRKKVDLNEPLRINYFTTTSWLQKIAFPLEQMKADQSRALGITSWDPDLSVNSQQ